MGDVIRLGGSIELVGAEVLDPASMIVLKKIVGNYTREFSQRTVVEKLLLAVTKTAESISLSGVLVTNAASFTAETQHRNLFMALDVVLKKLDKDLAES